VEDSERRRGVVVIVLGAAFDRRRRCCEEFAKEEPEDGLGGTSEGATLAVRAMRPKCYTVLEFVEIEQVLCGTIAWLELAKTRTSGMECDRA